MELLIGFLPSNVAPNFYDQWKDICVSFSFDYFLKWGVCGGAQCWAGEKPRGRRKPHYCFLIS